MRPCLKRERGREKGGGKVRKGEEGRGEERRKREKKGKIAPGILIQRGRDLCLVSVGEKKIRILYKICTYFFPNYFGVYAKSIYFF